MADIKYYDVILKPVLTEKSMNAMAEKKYTFLVHPEATKAQVKEAVEKMFEGAKVAKVNTLNQDGKTKRRGMTYGKTIAKIQKVIIKSSKSSKRILRKIVKIGQMLNLLSVNILRTFRPKITVLKNSVIATKIFVESLHCI